MSVTQSASVFACYSKACAPPPVGKGGSLPRGASGGRRAPAAAKRSKPSAPVKGSRLRTEKALESLDSFSHAGLKVRVTSNGSGVFRAFVMSGKKSVGLIDMEVGKDGSVDWEEISLIKSAQGKGFGAAFLRKMIPLLREAGAKEIRLRATTDADPAYRMVGAAVWGKLGFDITGIPQPELADEMKYFTSSTGHKWPKGLVDRVRSGKASIKEVMDSDPGDFLNGKTKGFTLLYWNGVMKLDDVSLTAAATEVSLAELGEAFETLLGRRRSSRRSQRTTTTAVFACLSKACAPPPVGKGGSLKGGGTAPRTVGAGKGSSLRTSTNPSRVRVGSNAELGDASMRFRAAIQKESRGDSVFTKVLANERVTKALLEEDAFRKWFRSGERMSMSMVRRLGPAINDLAKTSIWKAAEKVLASKIENGEISDSQEVNNVKRLLDTNTNTAKRIETLLQYMSPRDLTSVLGYDAERFVAAVMVRQVIDRWARGSTYGTLSFNQHLAAAEVHGTPDAMKSYRKSRLAGAGNSVVEDSELMQAIVRAEYKVTQEWFKEQGITELRLYRGMTFKQSKTIDPPSNGSIVNVLMNPLSSWSHSFEDARPFGSPEEGQYGMIFSAIVPVELIQSIPLTGRGCLAEDEVVVIGAGGEASVSNVEYF